MSVAADVLHLDAIPLQHGPNQQPTVAVRGILFTAHQRNGQSSGKADFQPFNSLSELYGLGYALIIGMALHVVEGFIGWSTSQLLTHVDVSKSRIDDRPLKVWLVELRSKP